MAGESARNIIATGFIADTSDTASEFPSAGRDSSDPAFQAIYWRCIAVFLFSARLNNPNAEIMLFSNVAAPVIDGIDLGELCQRLDVLQVALPLTKRIPGRARWGTVFYVLDILDWMMANRPACCFSLFDSDVVVTAPLAPLFDSMETHAFGGYRMAYPADHSVNRLTPAQAAMIVASIDGAKAVPMLPIYGGELFAANMPLAAAWLPKIADLWDFTLEHASDEQAIHTEEHFWSIFFALHTLPIADAHGAVKRIATYHNFTTTIAGDEDVPAWHLPAEKRLGFADMFARLSRSGFPLAFGSTAFRSLAMEIFGIPRRGLAKQLRDSLKRARRLIARKLAKSRTGIGLDPA
ncbi:MAG: hypothetical protein V4808_07600 [Pseudomonadota bacterium]